MSFVAGAAVALEPRTTVAVAVASVGSSLIKPQHVQQQQQPSVRVTDHSSRSASTTLLQLPHQPPQQHHHASYRHILTHQERKKLRMPKRKAEAWPASILGDPDVLSLDDEGRFVLCKVCHVHYAVHGGKKPKPVIMNSGFRTRAWDVHKERTNSHRVQKKDGGSRNHSSATTTTTIANASGASQQKPRSVAPTGNGSTSLKTLTVSPGPPGLKTAGAVKTISPSPLQQDQSQLQSQSQPQPQQPPPAPMQTPSKQRPAAPRSQHGNNSPLKRPELAVLPLTSPRRRVFRTVSGSHAPWPAADQDDGPHRRSTSVDQRSSAQLPPQAIGEAATANATATASSSLPTVASTATLTRRSEKATSAAPLTSVQRDGMMRWRNMHDDVSRALNTAPKRAAPDAFPTAEELSRANADAADFGANREAAKKKLKSLDAEYDAKAFKRLDVHYDRRSASYKQYWGTLRDIYSAPTPGRLHTSATDAGHHRKVLPSLRRGLLASSDGSSDNSSHSHSHDNAAGGATTAAGDSASREPRSSSGGTAAREVREATTPDDTGLSEDSGKTTVVVHDQALVNAIDRLTGVVSKQLAAERHAHERESATASALATLTSAIAAMRAEQDSAFGRLLQIQERRLQATEAILQHKLRKEAARSSQSQSQSASSSSRDSHSQSHSSNNSSNGGVSSIGAGSSESRSGEGSSGGGGSSASTSTSSTVVSASKCDAV